MCAFILFWQYEGGYLDVFLTPSQKNYYNTMKKLGNRKPQKTIKRPKVGPTYSLNIDRIALRLKSTYLWFLWKKTNLNFRESIRRANQISGFDPLESPILDVYNLLFTIMLRLTQRSHSFQRKVCEVLCIKCRSHRFIHVSYIFTISWFFCSCLNSKFYLRMSFTGISCA